MQRLSLEYAQECQVLGDSKLKLGLFQNFLEQSYDELQLDHYILNIDVCVKVKWGYPLDHAEVDCYRDYFCSSGTAMLSIAVPLLHKL